MHFPDEIDTGHEMVPGEEAFLIMLKRPAACQKSPALTLTSYMADWSAAFAAAPHSQPRGRGFSHALVRVAGVALRQVAALVAAALGLVAATLVAPPPSYI